METSAALRANMVAEGCAATDLFLDVLSHLSPLQQARLAACRLIQRLCRSGTTGCVNFYRTLMRRIQRHKGSGAVHNAMELHFSQR